MFRVETYFERVQNTLAARNLRSFSLLCFTLAIIAALLTGYLLGNQQKLPTQIEVLRAATVATGTNMAVATGAVSDDSEGVFFLDFLTGDLQCLVYYPRTGAFGARFYTNVLTNLPAAGKNSQYLLVTGGAVSSRAAAGARPGNSLVYVTDTTSGNFAAYTVPWDRTSEGAARPQSGALIFVGGGPVRNYQFRDTRPSASGTLPDNPVANAPNTPQINAANAVPKGQDKQDNKPNDKKSKPATKLRAGAADDEKKNVDRPPS